MIYFLHGTDKDKARAKAHDLIQSLLKKKPDASFFKLDTLEWNSVAFEEYIGGQGLFENKYIVFLDRICSDKTCKEELLDKIKEIKESTNIFILLEEKIDKASLSKIEKNAEKTQEFPLKEIPKKESYNAFALADAFGRGDKKTAWILYRTSIDKGEAPEALEGMLFWKIKSMLLSGRFDVYDKEELFVLLDRLVSLYHDARRGFFDLEMGMEQFLLSVLCG